MRNRILIAVGGVVLILAVGGFLIFRGAAAKAAAAANLQTATVDRGTLVATVSTAGSVAAPQSVTLVWHTSGIVGKVNVKVGDTVEAGQVLMELDPAALSQSVIQAQADLISAQQALDTLLDPATTAQQLAQAEVTVAQDEQTVTTAQRTLNGALSPSVASYQDQYQRAQAALTAAQQNATITDYQTSLRAATDALTNATGTLNSVKALDAQYPGYGDQRNRMLNAQTAYDRALQDYQTALYRFQQAQTQDAQTIQDDQKSVDTLKANLAAAQAGPDQSVVSLSQAQLDVAQANLTKAQADLKKLQAGPDPQAVAAARAKVAAAQATVDQAQLTAPFRATVVAVSNKVGDSVDSGGNAIALADLTSLEVLVSVSEVDINRIVVGQAATLTLDAAPGQTFTGTVAEVTIFGQSSQGVVTFPVKIVVPKPSPQVKPGMTAAVSIVTDSRENVLMVPNRAVRVTGGLRSVTVLFEGQQLLVPVTLGLANETTSEVLTGLKEGDTLVLNVPTTTQTGGFGGGGGGGFLFGGGGGGFRGGG